MDSVAGTRVDPKEVVAMVTASVLIEGVAASVVLEGTVGASALLEGTVGASVLLEGTVGASVLPEEASLVPGGEVDA